MPFDGCFLALTAAELGEAAGARIERIYEPARDTLVFVLRRAGFRKKLLLSCRTGAPRAQFTELEYPNPANPLPLCMVLRKLLCGGVITGFTVENAERVLTANIRTYDEVGDEADYRLICELFGAKGNIILAAPDGRIAAAVRLSDLESEARIVRPGAAYTPPPRQNKLNPLEVPAAELAERIIAAGGPSVEAVTRTVAGVSPLIARELVYRAGADDREPFAKSDAGRLASALLMLKDTVKRGGTPTLLTRDGAAFDFTFFPVSQYGTAVKAVAKPSYGELLDGFYREKTEAERKAAESSDLLRLLRNRSARAEKKLAARRAELRECGDRETLRIYGELLKANAGAIKKGASSARVTNYYDPGLAEIEIPLRPSLSPAQNAARYFKEYKKRSNAAGMLAGLIEDAESELRYLDSVFDSLSRAETREDFSEIRAELAAAGYINVPKNAKRRKTAPRPVKFVTPGGFRVLVGKNNIQNDIITTELAGKDDLWFHVKNMPGAHVLLVTGGGAPSGADITCAAGLAAYYSKARGAAKAEVDCVKARYVKKPAGAKPGAVVFRNQTTLYVAPRAPDGAG